MINSNTPKAVKERPEYYDEFVEKFKSKRTTDDCMTPDGVYDVVLQWAKSEYGIGDETRILRPFWPGADYQAADYSGDCVVIDNPPFSILSSICRWYMAQGIRFLLFAPHLTLFAIARGAANYILCDAEVIYANGAVVKTSFVTNMGDDKIYCAPTLREEIHRRIANDKQKTRVNKPVFDYPANVCSAARLGKYVAEGMEWRVKSGDAQFVTALDAQRASGKGIFGCGFLISDRAAAEKAAAEKAAAITFQLSSREKAIIEGLNKGANKSE